MIAAACAGSMMLLAGCGADRATPAPVSSAVPADLVLRPGQLPPGFAPAQFSVSDLATADRARIDATRADPVTPPQCRPTADADLNPQLNAANSAVLAANRSDTGLVALVTTARRDIDADVRERTGDCAQTETTISSGGLSGAVVTTSTTTLPDPAGFRMGSTRDGDVEQTLVLRSVVTTRLPDATVRTQIGYSGYVLVRRTADDVVTVSLTVNGATSDAANPPQPAPEPMSAHGFGELFATAVRNAVD